jgi:hypothetical protein
VLFGPVVADGVDLDDPADDGQLHGIADQLTWTCWPR